jgi:hydrogenase nickel incorporation protein HypA/HybF
MHEIAIAGELRVLVLQVAEREKLSKITKVNLCFGKMVQIVPDIFKFAFIESVRETLASDAEIEIEIIPVKLKCRICGKEFGPEETVFTCPDCSSAETDIIEGRELFVRSIEGE